MQSFMERLVYQPKFCHIGAITLLIEQYRPCDKVSLTIILYQGNDVMMNLILRLLLRLMSNATSVKKY